MAKVIEENNESNETIEAEVVRKDVKPSKAFFDVRKMTMPSLIFAMTVSLLIAGTIFIFCGWLARCVMQASSRHEVINTRQIDMPMYQQRIYFRN